MTSLSNFISDLFESKATKKKKLYDFYKRTEPSPLSLLPDENTAHQLVKELGSLLATLQSASRPVGPHHFSTTTHHSLPGTVWVEFQHGSDRLFEKESDRGKYLYPQKALEATLLEIRILPGGKYEVTDFSTVEGFDEVGRHEHRLHKIHKELDAGQVAILLVDFAKRMANLDLSSITIDNTQSSFQALWSQPHLTSDKVTVNSMTSKRRL